MDGIWGTEKRLWTRSHRGIREENCILSGTSQPKREGGLFLLCLVTVLFFLTLGAFFSGRV